MSRELELWKGQFGDDYTDRNELTDEILAQRTVMWADIMRTPTSHAIHTPLRILEIGANSGINLAAISKVMSREHELYAVEPNEKARMKLIENIPSVRLIGEDAANIAAPNGGYDFVITSGVLIHMNDEYLEKAIGEIYRVSSKWILCAEYFSAEPVSKQYRGVDDFIYLRDYGSIWLDRFRLRCLGYGFCWKRLTGIDNVTWWLFEKVH